MGFLHGISSLELSIETELDRYLGLGGDGTVSQHEIQAYVDSLHLTQVSTEMVTQVILLLLDLNLGETRCDVSHFAQLVASPPAWRDIKCARALLGTLHEPPV